MRIVLWHGYLLGGTGSNVYTRALAREWTAPGTTSPSSARSAQPERFDLGGARGRRARSSRTASCPSSCSTATRASTRGCSRTSRRRARALRRGERGGAARAPAGRPRLREPRAPGRGGGGRDGRALRVKAHGSELEYSMRGRPDLVRGAPRRSRAPTPSSSAPPTSAACSRRCVGHVERVHEVPPGVDVDEFRPEDRAAGARRPARGVPPRPAQSRATRTSGCPTRATRARLERFFAGELPTVLYFGKLLENKGVHLLLEALAGSTRAR